MNNQIQNLESSIQNEAEPDRADVAHSAHARFTTKARTERIFAAKSFRTGNNVHSYLIKGKWAKVGKGGLEAGKWTGFSHFETAFTRLFPHVSTQVVDFPRICTVRVCWEAVKWAATDEAPMRHGLAKDLAQKGTEKTEPSGVWNQYGVVDDRELLEIIEPTQCEKHNHGWVK